MKVVLGLLLFLYCSAITIPLYGQAGTLSDAMESVTCEELLARLDVFATHAMSNSTASIGHIVMFPGPNAIENAKHERYLKFYIARHKLQDKLSVYTLPQAPKLRFEFWSTSTRATPVWKTSPLTHKLNTTGKPILFDSDLLEMSVEKRKGMFAGVACSACCISNLDWLLLSKFLDANPKLVAYVVVRGKPSRHRDLKSYLAADMRNTGLNPNKVRYLFARKNLRNDEHFSEVAVFLSDRTIKTAQSLRHDFENH